MGGVLTTADGEVVPDTILHCTLQAPPWQHVRLQEKEQLMPHSPLCKVSGSETSLISGEDQILTSSGMAALQ